MVDQLTPVPLVTPGFKGLNKAQSSVPDLDPGWAIECQNLILDASGRLASRQGWSKLTVSALGGTPAIGAMAELALASGTTVVVSAANNKLYSGTTTLTDITGAVAITANNWQFVTFNGKIYGYQLNHQLISWDGVAASFVVNPLSAGVAPVNGTCMVAAFGRLYVLDADNQTIKYCALLDATTWNGASAGSVNMATVWTRGIDQVIGLAAAGSKLVAFGTKQIVMFADQAGTSVGLNPQNIYVCDTIEGTGLAARDTIQSTGEGDLTFLSPTGVQSLQRLLSSGRDNPVKSLDGQVHDYFNSYFLNEVAANVKSFYSPVNRFYVILLPVSTRAFCYDTRQPLQDGTLRVTEWPAVTWTSCVNLKSGSVLFGEKGIVGQYGGYLDNVSSFIAVYNSPNIALSGQGEGNLENRVKILKRMKAVLFFGGTTNVTFSWGVDFQGLNTSALIALTGVLSEYGIAQYSINEYGGGAGLAVVAFPLSLSGRWLQFGFSAVVNGYQIAIQQMDAYVKVGNMV